MTNKIIKDNNKDIEKLKNNLEELNILKNKKQKILEDNLSKKETLQEMCKTIINNIKNNNHNHINNDNYFIDISIEEIKNNNKESFIKRVLKIINFINNNQENKYYDIINIAINQVYLEFFSHLGDNKLNNNKFLIKSFFYNLSLLITSQIACKATDKDISVLLQFILKINVISDNINKIIHFLNYEYKELKNDIKNNIEILENKNLSLQDKKKELIDSKNKTNEKIELLSQKKTPFCDKTIYQKKINKKDLVVNNISSTINFSTECINKTNSKNINKNNLFNLLTVNSCKKEKEKETSLSKDICRNMIKFINKKSKTKDYILSHSNKISEGKICVNGMSGNCSTEKNKKFAKKLDLKDINKKLKIIGWTQKKDKQENLLYKNRQNGLNYDIRDRNNNNENFKELVKFQNLTDYNNNSNINTNLIQVNTSYMKMKKEKDNGKTTNIDIKKTNLKEYNLFNFNNYNYIKNKFIKTERSLEPENITQITENIEINDTNRFLNDNIKPIYKNKNYKMRQNIYLYDKISFEKKRFPSNINNGCSSNFLNKYLTKKDDYKCINNNNDIDYKKIKVDTNNAINRMRENKTFNKEIKNKNKNKNKKYNTNIFNTFEISNRDNREKINNTSNKNNNLMESFCYYKLLEKNSKFFNPLNNNNTNLSKLLYNEGYISIDTDLNCIKINSNKIILNNNNNNYINNFHSNNLNSIDDLKTINIQLKEISNVFLTKIMKNIVRIHDIFLKYNVGGCKDKDKKSKNITNINKMLNKREIMNIKDMEQSEKIKAGLCNFFSFIIEFGNNNRLECILINFMQFNIWFNYLEGIANNNIKTPRCIINGSSSGNIIKNNGIFKHGSLYSKIKGRQIENIRRNISGKKSQRDYSN